MRYKDNRITGGTSFFSVYACMQYYAILWQLSNGKLSLGLKHIFNKQDVTSISGAGDKMLKGAMFINLSSYNPMYAIWSACAALCADNLAECCFVAPEGTSPQTAKRCGAHNAFEPGTRMPRICGGTTDIVFASCHARNLCAFLL